MANICEKCGFSISQKIDGNDKETCAVVTPASTRRLITNASVGAGALLGGSTLCQPALCVSRPNPRNTQRAGNDPPLRCPRLEDILLFLDIPSHHLSVNIDIRLCWPSTATTSAVREPALVTRRKGHFFSNPDSLTSDTSGGERATS